MRLFGAAVEGGGAMIGSRPGVLEMNPVDTQARIFIQARMESARFPGKVLASFRGRPVLAWVIERLLRVVDRKRIVVATSDRLSDNPVAAVVGRLGIDVFRGSHQNVAQRFQDCLECFPCPWVFRISADSPLIDPSVLVMISKQCSDEFDLVTNVFPRTFPRGHSVELIRSETFLSLDTKEMTSDQKEHVTQIYYDSPSSFRIRNVESGDPSRAKLNYCVDTPEDLNRLEVEVSQGLLPSLRCGMESE